MLSILTKRPKSEIWAEKGWPVIGDDEVLTPGGGLYPPYQTMATSIRRAAIAITRAEADENPRAYLAPLAEHMVRVWTREREQLLTGHGDDAAMLVELLDRNIANLKTMFPEIDKPAEQATD